MRVTRIVLLLTAILITGATCLAQGRKPISRQEQSKYIVSAKPGVVNVVEGEVSIQKFIPFATPDTLIAGDELQTNDTVRTGSTGRVEILLNPGCYLRLGENSEIAFLFDGFDANQLKLLRGSAIVEASVVDAPILIQTPKAKLDIVKPGLYRFKVSTDAKTEVAVRKGRVVAGKTAIKDGKRATVEESTTAIEALNKNETDQLDDWSKQRAKGLIAANRSLSTSMLRRSFGALSLYNSWVYDPICRCYTFLPSTGGFSSPYGGGYSVCNPYWYSAPRNYGGGQSSGGGGGSYSGGSGGSSGGSGTSGGGASGGGNIGGGNSFPSRGGGDSGSRGAPHSGPKLP